MSVLLVLEESGGKIKRASWEALAAAHRLAPAQENTADGFSIALHQLIRNQSDTKWVVFPHTYQVRDYAPALACRMGEVLIGDVTGIEDGPVFTR